MKTYIDRALIIPALTDRFFGSLDEVTEYLAGLEEV